MNEFDDALSNSLSDRASALPGTGADLADVRQRVRHHQVVRRSVAAACVTVLALGGVAAVAMRSTEPTPAAADATDATDDGVAPSGSCAAGQILSAEGDVVFHEGRPMAMAAGQCISVSDLPVGVNSTGAGFCQVMVSAASPVYTTAPLDSTVSTITAISSVSDRLPIPMETCMGVGGMAMCSETGEILSGVTTIDTAWSGVSDSVPPPPDGVLVGGCSIVSVDASDAPGFEPAVDTTVTIPAG